ncbi:MAG: VOC family protein [Acidobacteriota bacterium]|nr:MAG: VOC family protein [Acidobacteriota bacterium]
MKRYLARRTFLVTLGLPVIAGAGGCKSSVEAPSVTPPKSDRVVPATAAVDHLVFGFRDLDQGIAWAENNLGVKAVFGGVHPGAGTRNALLSLGGRQYLEIIAPDPAQPGVVGRFGDLKALAEPKLITWASATDSIDDKVRLAGTAGYRINGPRDGSRARPDGRMLQWKTLSIENDLGGVIPFFIQWGAGSTHPAEDSPAGCRLEDLRFEHPQPDRVKTMLRNLGVDAHVDNGSEMKITATVAAPKGRITFS